MGNQILPIAVPQPFEVQSPSPIDTRTVKETVKDRDNIANFESNRKITKPWIYINE
jgi:hypothetical protein